LGEVDRFDELSEKIHESLKEENPNMVSAILERTCFLKCTHCLYKKDHKTSKSDSENSDLTEVIANMMKQMPDKEDSPQDTDPMFLHEGRILQPWHFDVFEKIRAERSDAKIGLIDAGIYTKHIDLFKEKDIKLDWLDISIDGTEESHNTQRDPEVRKAFEIALNGLSHAREVTKSHDDGGRVTSLMTLTNINNADIAEVADLVFSENRTESAYDSDNDAYQNYVDELHITTMSPALPENVPLEISYEEMKVAWEQIREASEKHMNEDKNNIFLKIYRTEDLEKLASAVGEKKFYDAITNETVDPESDRYDEAIESGIGIIKFYIDGIPIQYYPSSTWPTETIHVDADSVYRAPHCQQWSLEELNAGRSVSGDDISKYSFQELTSKSSYLDAYQDTVDKYWEDFGKNYLLKEVESFRRIREKSFLV